jgi:large subunit ribosomal protein L17
VPRPKKGHRFGGGPAHHRLLMANMAAHLFESEAIVTTEAKAKALRPFAERLITKAKHGGTHKRRQVVATLHDETAAAKLFAEIGPRYADRNGGYTRILKLGPRAGDSARMARVELV